VQIIYPLQGREQSTSGKLMVAHAGDANWIIMNKCYKCDSTAKIGLLYYFSDESEEEVYCCNKHRSYPTPDGAMLQRIVQLYSNSKMISKLINKYLNLIKVDHHKTKDGYFKIETIWDGYDDAVPPTYVAIHNGYLNKLEGHPRNRYESAEEDMIEFLERIIAEYQPEDWGE